MADYNTYRTTQSVGARQAAEIAALEGETNPSNFRSNSFLGKLTYNMSENQLLEFTGDWRHETDIRGFGGQFAGADRSFSASENLQQDIATGRVKHTFLGSNWVNEAFVAYQYYNWNPEPTDFTTVGREYRGFGVIGGRDSRQDISQKRLSVRDDITFTGLQILRFVLCCWEGVDAPLAVHRHHRERQRALPADDLPRPLPDPID